jgi:hypothetical protein
MVPMVTTPLFKLSMAAIIRDIDCIPEKIELMRKSHLNLKESGLCSSNETMICAMPAVPVN